MKRFIYGILALGTAFAVAACTADKTAPAAKPDGDNTVSAIPSDACAGILLVKFEPYVSDIVEQAQAVTRAGGAEPSRSGILSVDEVLDIVGTYSIERVFPVDQRHEARTRESELHLWYAVRFDENQPLAEVAERLSSLGEIKTVNFNRTLKRAYKTEAVPLSKEALEAAQRMQAQTRAAQSDYPFNDALLKYQWDIVNRGVLYDHNGDIVPSAGAAGADFPAYEGPAVIAGADVGCEDAWKLSAGDESIIVAVLDEGVCVSHPDLQGSLWENEGEIYRSYEDNDGNGYAGDYHGYNFVRDSGVISTDDMADSGHGTHVAGVIAAQNNNGEGIASIAGGNGSIPGVKIMSCQIFSGNYVASILAEVRAIKYAADNGAVILQCSWGYTSGAANQFDWGYGGYSSDEQWALYNPLEKDALDYFVHNAGSPNGVIEGGIAVFAGGNEYAAAAGYPGAYGPHIAVSATAADYTPAVYTNYGTGIDLAAPGGDFDYYGYVGLGKEGLWGAPGAILSTLPFNVSDTGYGYMEGTSMACPHVSGVLALGLSYAAQQRRHFTADEFRELLLSTTTPIDDFLSGSKLYYQYATDLEDNQVKEMNMANYRGQMGTGQVNAAALMAAIDGKGIEMRCPNLYIPLDGAVTLRPSLYFENGRSLTYTLTVEDATIASGSYADGKLTVKGLAEGVTKAAVKASNGKEQSIIITVRKQASGNGWL